MMNHFAFFSFCLAAACCFLAVCSTDADFDFVNFNGFVFLLKFWLFKLDYLLEPSLEFFFDSAISNSPSISCYSYSPSYFSMTIISFQVILTFLPDGNGSSWFEALLSVFSIIIFCFLFFLSASGSFDLVVVSCGAHSSILNLF